MADRRPRQLNGTKLTNTNSISEFTLQLHIDLLHTFSKYEDVIELTLKRGVHRKTHIQWRSQDLVSGAAQPDFPLVSSFPPPSFSSHILPSPLYVPSRPPFALPFSSAISRSPPLNLGQRYELLSGSGRSRQTVSSTFCAKIAASRDTNMKTDPVR